jgi:hypothetical protein
MTIWPFNREKRDIKTLPPLSDDTHTWGVAEAGSAESPLVVRYNQAARDWSGHPQLPIKLGFAIPLNSPNEGGLPDAEENAQINQLEDIIVREIEAKTRALHALTLTTGKMKEFVFYIPQGLDIKTLHETIRSLITTHEVHCVAVIERDWDSYRQFAPK